LKRRWGASCREHQKKTTERERENKGHPSAYCSKGKKRVSPTSESDRWNRKGGKSENQEEKKEGVAPSEIGTADPARKKSKSAKRAGDEKEIGKSVVTIKTLRMSYKNAREKNGKVGPYERNPDVYAELQVRETASASNEKKEQRFPA